jgi:hypothetical protein
MDIRERLARLDRTTRREPAPAADPGPERPGGCTDWRAALGLAPRTTPAGDAWARDVVRPGTAPPSLGVDLRGLLREPQAARDAGELLLLDTETTGLAGGTGSIPFLVGLAWWESGGLRVRQYFLPGPGREAPILAELERLASRFRAVVTFNGATFDLPLLRTRALLARRSDPLAGLAGWDLLLAARRLWGRRLPDVRQQTVETLVAGEARHADIPGALIPQTYFDFLRDGATAELRRVLRHNRWDLEGMVRILGAVVAAAEGLDPAVARPPVAPPAWQDAWACGRIWELRRDRRRAAAWIERAVAGSGLLLPVAAEPRDAPAERFAADAIRILKRTRRWELVRTLVERSLVQYGAQPWLLREAAILYEHRLGRPDLALAHATLLGEERRLERLRRKLGQTGALRADDGCSDVAGPL